MSDKYLTKVSGVTTLKEAIDSSAGAGDAGKIPALDSGGKLASNMMPAGIGADSVTKNASENLASKDLVNLWNDGGTTKVRKADATSAGKRAHGFVQSAVTSGNPAEVILDGTISGLSGLTVGEQFLSTTAGTCTTTAPSASGNVIQSVGFAISSTELAFESGEVCNIA